MPDGLPLRVRVKLCWRPRDKTAGSNPYHATQLIAKIKSGDWEGSLTRYIDGARAKGITHFVFIGRDAGSISQAALVSCSALLPIWLEQARISDELISLGRLGNRRKNHARNGSSPTLWLRDETAPQVTDALWKHSQVVDLLKMPAVFAGLTDHATWGDDSLDDLPMYDPSSLGSDGGLRVSVNRSGVKRDPRVRAEVVRRARGRCERAICGTTRNYVGFFDVHHIFGADVSDRVYNCVALCPNCHREAHYAPDRDEINSALLDFALRFKSKGALSLIDTSVN
jgi:5-methylcytosine-specific restriction protein A